MTLARFGTVLLLVSMVIPMACGDLSTPSERADQSSTGAAPQSDPDPESDSDSSSGPAPGSSVEVRRLADGDSGLLTIDGEEIEFRLLGYNAPERYEGDDGPLSCNGAAAEAALDDLIASAGPALRFVGYETDRFGRVLGDFTIDDRSVVEELVSAGWGLATGEEARRDLMIEASTDRRGLWGDGCGSPSADGLVVDRVEPDPPGRDEEDLNGEYVELVNRGSEPIDLDGWDIRDDSSSHRFDLAGTIEPGDRLIVRTGSGLSGDGELFLGSDTPVWSNRGDSVLVIDPGGVVVAWAFV